MSLSRYYKLLLLVLLVLAVAVMPGSALAKDKGSGGEDPKNKDELPTEKPHPEKEAAPDQVIVKFKENAGTMALSDARSKEGLKKKKKLDLINAEVDTVEGQSVDQAIQDLNSRPDVEYAEPDYIVHPTGYADDPRFGDLWGLNNTGQAVNSHPAGTSDVDVNAEEASAITQGDPNLVVAVIDSGVDFSHPDLKDRAWKNPGESGVDGSGNDKATNGIDDDGDGYVDDVNGWDFVNNDNTVYDPGNNNPHGTHVSGTIAASADGQGVVGVAPNVKIMALKFLGPDGSGYTSDAVKALGYAKKTGAKICNNSWGGGGYNQALKDAIDASGMLFVAAAGNDGSNSDSTPSYPASYDSPNVLSVAAINDQGNLASFSNYGASSVDISAPGVDVLSSVPGGSWEFWNGTSMATPHATGVAALAASVNPGLRNDPASLKKLLMDNGKPAPATAGKTATGKMPDAYTTVQAAGGPPSQASPPPPPPAHHKHRHKRHHKHL